MKAVIIDDNSNARAALKSDIQDYCPQLQIVGEADGVETAQTIIKETTPEIIFLDINMGDGTGFDLLERYKPVDSFPFKVIFTTAYDEYALQAFKYAAVDYLLKPIDSESLKNAVNRLNTRSALNEIKKLEQLMQHIATPTLDRITLPEAERISVVEISNIIRCESDKNYTTFFLAEGEKITVSKTIKEYETLLEKNNFLRVHHSHLVNLNNVKEVVKVDGPYLKMKDGSSVPVSHRKKEELYKRIRSFG